LGLWPLFIPLVIVKKKSKKAHVPEIWAVGGGKGGVGKSVICTLLASWLARMGHRTILLDADLGGANLHTLLGVKIPPRTLGDFLAKKYDTLEEICFQVEHNLRLISGASEVLSLANPLYVQKAKIIQHLFKLDCDYVVLDLGAGASFNVLDFFLVSHRQLTILTSQPTAIQNAYGFVRNAVYRRLSQMVRSEPSLKALVQTAMNPNNEKGVEKIEDLLLAMEKEEGPDVIASLRKELKRIRPVMITNMARKDTDKIANRIVQVVSKKYLKVHCADFGSVTYDDQIDTLIRKMAPLTTLDSSSEALTCIYNIASELLEKDGH
jgi:flagellar biosynthesis protein FlhG